MTDREIKTMLRNAYSVPESLDGKSFIRKHEKRTLQIFEIIKLEFRYMGRLSVISEVFLMLLMWAIARSENPDLIWAVSSMIPLCAMAPIILLSGSERSGMAELEAASRFSLRYVRLVRMFILGIAASVLLIVPAVIFKSTQIAPGGDYLIMVVIPYLAGDLGAMAVTRKCHGKENVIGIIAVCGLICFLPSLIKRIRMLGMLPNTAIWLALIVLVVLVIRECFLYVKESESLSWNLC